MMKTTSLLLAALGAAPSILAHTVFTNFYVDGVDQGDAVAMRMRMDAAEASFPLSNLYSNDLACNVGGEKGVALVQPVSDGATLTFEFRSWPDDASKESLDSGHKGPCAVYMKKVDSAIEDQGHGSGWFKIFASGYTASDQKWCTDKLIANNGHLSISLPKGLIGGYYLIRPEILALHNAANGDPQFYAGCAQVFLQSTGDLVAESTVSIPGYVKPDDEALSWNIYTADNAKYPLPGPGVARLISGSSAAMGSASTSQTSQTEGQKPSTCILQNGNFCFKEVPDYTTEQGCWSANQDCWAQNKICWANTAPTGGKGCKIWEGKCKGIEKACSEGNFNGPPNKGKDLDGERKRIDVGVLLPTSSANGGVPTLAVGVKGKKVAAPEATSEAVATEAGSSETGSEETPAPTTTQKPETTLIPVATTPAPAPECPEGSNCVTLIETVVSTKVEYVTVYKDAERRSLRGKRMVVI